MRSGEEEKKEEEEEKEKSANIKSNNPHLAGGEKTTRIQHVQSRRLRPIRKRWFRGNCLKLRANRAPNTRTGHVRFSSVLASLAPPFWDLGPTGKTLICHYIRGCQLTSPDPQNKGFSKGGVPGVCILHLCQRPEVLVLQFFRHNTADGNS